MATPAPPRRFKPEPIESSTKSSKQLALESTETTTKSFRKFIPEPIETISRTSRKMDPGSVQTTSKTTRKFAPEPIETMVKSSRNKNVAESSSNTRGKFSPRPIEITTRSNRKKIEKEADEQGPDQPQQDTSSLPEILKSSIPEEKRPRRRFAPQLIETAKRSRKAGDTGPAILPSDKTEATPDDGTHSPRKTRSRPVPSSLENTPASTVIHSPHFLEIKRAASPLAMRQNSRGSTRSHSFRVPDLEPIESSESEESTPPSLSTSPSAASDHSHVYKEATRMRESVDDRFSGYLLELAARAAEKQLREQAMAAFPNDDHHEPVDHFIDRDSDDSELGSGIMSSDERDNGFARRESAFTKINWELLAMQQHREKLEQQQAKDKEQRDTAMRNARGPSPHGAWGSPSAGMFANSTGNKNIIAGWQKDGEMDRMRSGARPPMLGGDIKFPRCRSPEPARFDPTQGSHAMRNAMCYLTEQSQAAEPEGGLWHGKENPSNRPSLWSTGGSRPPSRGGLWGGCCIGSGLTPPRGPTGLMTPRIEVDNPFETPHSTPAPGHLPPSPPASNADISSIDEKLSTELSIEEEFDDNFVTQVYNYLSLGYPSIARKFDEELGKISRIPVTELRQDDHLAQSRGYIRLGEDGNLKDSEITEETCMRWRALRLYIQEWARQQPRMVTGVNTLGGFGVAVRRGSWAW